METSERRQYGDRRRHARGGRRPGDRAGHAPLVFVVTSDANHLSYWEARLLDRQFAVIACNGPGPARDAFRALRPDVIVATSSDCAALREQLPFGRLGGAVPLVELSDTPEPFEPVLGRIRQALQETMV
jgi:hypothetical protein